jgi:Fe-Mn family superoxide dismutase
MKIYPFHLPELDYQLGDLAPMMSAETLSLHHGQHFRTYVDKLNQLVHDSKYEGMTLSELVRKAPVGPFADNAGQVLNHQLFFEQLTPSQHAKQPSGELMLLITQSFGSFGTMIEQLDQAARLLFGSGWVFLAANTNGQLQILSLPNGDNPLRHGQTPLLAIDVWEHAYYLDYHNRRADYLKHLWPLINWRIVSTRLQPEVAYW